MKLLKNGLKGGPCFVFAHGAGADMHSEFMTEVAIGLAEKGIQVVRFNFPYMVKREEDGKKRPPDRAPKLLDAYSEVIRSLRSSDVPVNVPVVIGGKSMGGRMASLLMADADRSQELNIRGTAVFGFPFHAPGKPPKDRIDHLKDLALPLYVVQGSRDTMGTQEEVNTYDLSDQVTFNWLEDGNHDLKPRKASGFTHEQHIKNAIESVAEFIKRVSG